MFERRRSSEATPRSRRVTPMKSLPTEYRTPRSTRMPFSTAGQVISTSTVKSVLDGKYSDKHTAIIDCRFAYEFHGGHIPGAVNFPPGEIQNLVEYLFGLNGLIAAHQKQQAKLLIIMHCEFSQCRAPRMAAELLRHSTLTGRSQQIEVYVMKGGYSEFYSLYPEVCEPRGYLAM
jgi:rhodanese-related sulfurtransferase